VAVAAAVALAVAGVVTVRAGGGLDQEPSVFWAGDVAAPPDLPDLIAPDRLPGRTPIPAPLVVGYDKQTVLGRLPVDGGPSQFAAKVATRLVLGRYCQVPATYDVRVSPEAGWNQVSARAFRIDRGGYALSVALRLVWIRSAYAWTGRLTELGSC
jgi:hypothetical protein